MRPPTILTFEGDGADFMGGSLGDAGLLVHEAGRDKPVTFSVK